MGVYYNIRQTLLHYEAASLLHHRVMLIHYEAVITLTGEYYIISCNTRSNWHILQLPMSSSIYDIVHCVSISLCVAVSLSANSLHVTAAAGNEPATARRQQ